MNFFSMPAQKKSGFTIIELVISIGIFSVIVVAAISITISVMNGQLKAADIQAIQDNIRFSLELITKEMRTGSGYNLTGICGALGTEITFTTSAGQTMVYYLDPATNSIMRIKGSSTCSNARQFTADEVVVEKLNFLLRGNGIGPNDGQPVVTIIMQVRSKNAKFQNQSSMNLQTTITQRLRDF